MAWHGYKIISKLGEGGMATVYKAIQESLQRPVAIKVLAANMKELPEIEARFENESLIIAQLNHPHIIHVIDKGLTVKGRPYFVMEYVRGMTLEECINRDKLAFKQKTDALVQICKALAYAHKNGVIHRDIKPANILIDSEWQVRVADFGIAHFYESQDDNPLHVGAQNFLGTTAYMAPELEKNQNAASVQSDLFALGMLMYELFTGICPQDEIPPPRNFEPDLPAGLNDLIVRCLHREPGERPRSADDVKNVLLHLSQGEHLSKALKDRAGMLGQGIEAQYSLLDVFKEDQHNSVYLYEDVVKNRLLVVKKLAKSSKGLKENRLLSRLQHPSVAAIVAVAESASGFTLISEYLKGGSLAERMVSSVDVLQMMKWAAAIADGLTFAHRNRVIHGNLRPGNILLDEEGQVKLTDFGLRPHYHNTGDSNWFENASFTGVRGDLYGLGAICFYSLTGDPPQYRGERLIRDKKFNELPRRVQEVIGRLVEKDASKGYPNSEVALADLKVLVRKLQQEEEQQQKENILYNIKKSAQHLEAEPESSFRWQAWLIRLLFIAFIAEEIIYGYGIKAARPYLDPYLEKFSNGGVLMQWRDKNEEMEKQPD